MKRKTFSSDQDLLSNESDVVVSPQEGPQEREEETQPSQRRADHVPSCRKHGIDVTGCSNWDGGDSAHICDLCLSVAETKGDIATTENSTDNLPCSAYKKPCSTVKTVSTFEMMPILDGGDVYENR